MGASVAYHLARRGMTDVVLLEREKMLATGSTGRNAGGVRHQFSNEANIRLSIESIGLLERFADEVGHPIDFHQDGYLFLLSTPDRASRPSSGTSRCSAASAWTCEWLDAAGAAALTPGLGADGVLAATFCQRDGIADPNGVTMGFAKTAQALGVADRARRRGDRHHARGPSRDRGRDVARDDRNADRGERRRSVRARDRPDGGRRRAGRSDPPPHLHRRRALQPPQVPSSHIMVIDFDTTFYFHREGAGLLFGMGERHEPPTFDTTVQWDFLPQVIDVAVTRLPALADASISHAWAGLYEMSPDGNPIIGAADGVDGLYLINGFSGHGFQHSPAAGRILADVITGRDPQFDLTPFAAGRFAKQGAAAGERYVV